MFKKKIIVIATLIFATSASISQEYSIDFQSKNFQISCTKIGEDGSNSKVGEDGSNNTEICQLVPRLNENLYF